MLFRGSPTGTARGPGRVTDEMPNCQVLQREPICRSVPGSIERQEFEYKRCGTVNVLAFLIVHSGQMEAACPECKNALNHVEQLRAFRRRHRGLRGVYLDPGWRPQSHGEFDGGFSGIERRLVASSIDPRARFVAESGRVAQRSVQPPIPETEIAQRP